MSIFRGLRPNRLRSGERQPAEPAQSLLQVVPAAAIQPAGEWSLEALHASPVAWARIDDALHVIEASDRATQMMHAAVVPDSLIKFSRTPEIEDRAKEVLAGEEGPWDVLAAHFDRRLRMTGQRIPGGAVLYFEDVTELRRLESVRTEFVANLAHELRTPVTSLRLAIETLTRDLPPDEAKIFLGRMIEEADYLSSVLDTLKELAELERGSLRVDRERFQLGALVGETWQRVKPEGSRVELSVLIEPDVTLTADRPKIGEVLQNFLQNAERYSPVGGTVEIGCKREPGELSVWVRDEGPGISPLELPRIFERFYKVDRSRTRGGGGSGLGLAIAKHLIEAHGGRIWAESAGTSGTRVGFTLPLLTP